MATLNIRNLPDEVHRRLRVRAAKAGRSMEAEARAILTAACASADLMSEADVRTQVKDLQDLVDRLYGGKKPKNVVDDLIAERRREAAPKAPTTARELRDLIDRLYGGRKPTGVVDDLLAERRREATREASES